MVMSLLPHFLGANKTITRYKVAEKSRRTFHYSEKKTNGDGKQVGE